MRTLTLCMLRCACALLVAIVVACGAAPSAHDNSCGGGGGDEPNDGGGGNAAACSAADDCPGPHWRCERRTCVNGVCGHEYAPEGTPDLVDSFPGDCSILVCDGAGRSYRRFDASDFGDDGDSCTSELCVDGGGRFVTIASNGDRCMSYIGGEFTVGTCLGGKCVDM